MKRTIPELVRAIIAKYSMISRGDRVLIGLSGGPDSVCLLNVLASLKDELDIELTAAYIDHGLRPAETPAEIDFCFNLCKGRDIPFTARPIDVRLHAEAKRLNKQEAARQLRYAALEEIAADNSSNLIAIAHNADDQAETLLINLVRGSGPLGLSGIPPVRGRIIRPLIEIERKDIAAYLSDKNISFVTDSSNLTNDYLRNRIRHSLIPSLKNMNRDFVSSVLRTTTIFRDEERYFDILVTKTLMKLISRKSNCRIELFLAPMEHMDTAVLRRVLRRAISETRDLKGLSLDHIEELMQLIKSGKSGDRIYLPNALRAIKAYATLVLTAEAPARLGEYLVHEPGDIALREAGIVLQLSIVEPDEAEDVCDRKRIACLDAGKLKFPLLIRPRISGDCFYPGGFGKRKKLQDYFVDEKIPRDERDTVPLLVSGDDIACIVGHRIDERYKVDDNTEKVLLMEIRHLKF